MNSMKYVPDLFSTPSSKRKLNDTYIKTPRVRNLFCGFNSKREHEINVENSFNKLKDIGLIGSKWETYRVNALYNFSYKTSMLVQYQKILSTYIKKAVLQNQFELPDKSQLIIKVEPLPFTGFTKNDTPAIKITIMTEDEDDRIPCFTGFLLSIGRKEGFMENERIRAGAIILPLFLVEYEDKLFLESTICFLQENFRCIINPLIFSPYDLMWMLALWSCPENRKCVSTTILRYDVPIEELNSIEYAIDPKSISQSWRRTVTPIAGDISEEQVNAFISVLEEHFYEIFSIHLSHFQLSLIKTPVARVEGNHSIVIWDSNELYSVMRHLTHLAQEIIK